MGSYLYDRSTRGWTQLAPASALAVPLDLAKRHLRLDQDFTDDDDYVTGLIRTAQNHCADFMKRAITFERWRITLDRFPTWGDSEDPYFWLYRRGIIDVPRPKLHSVDRVAYIDTSGAQFVLQKDVDFIVDMQDDFARLEPVYGQFWPITQFRIACTFIDYTSGYTGADGDTSGLIPPEIKHAILMLVGALYENRETMIVGQGASMLPFGYMDLLSPHIAWSFK